jgi:adenylate cyclase
VDGFFYDLSLAVQGARPGVGGEPVAVIAVDSESLDSQELAATPRVLLGPFWAKLIAGLAKGGVKAIGFDIIFSYSANRFPALDPQYDPDFYDALALHHGQLVLARSAGLPVAAAIEAAVYDLARMRKEEPAAIAFAELIPDSDGVQRRVALFVDARRAPAADFFRRTARPRLGPLNAGSASLAPSAPLEQSRPIG